MTESPDEDYRRAAVDLLGAIAYGELSAFERLVEDGKMAPGIDDKIAIGAMATDEFGHLQKLVERLEQLGADPAEAMQAFRDSFDSFHAHTAPSDYYEGLIKAYVGDGLAADFYREIAAYLDTRTRDLIVASLTDAGQSRFVVDRVRSGIAADPRLGGRLALWGRRLMGEALTQAQRVAAERDALSALLAGGVDRPGLDLAAIGRMFSRITELLNERGYAVSRSRVLCVGVAYKPDVSDCRESPAMQVLRKLLVRLASHDNRRCQAPHRRPGPLHHVGYRLGSQHRKCKVVFHECRWFRTELPLRRRANHRRYTGARPPLKPPRHRTGHSRSRKAFRGCQCRSRSRSQTRRTTNLQRQLHSHHRSRAGNRLGSGEHHLRLRRAPRGECLSQGQLQPTPTT